MLTPLTRTWWKLALRGLAAILCGLVAWVWPGLTLIALAFLFGASALFGGAFAIGAALRAAGARQHRWPLVLDGMLGIAAGVTAISYPGITTLALLYVIACWALISGVIELVAALQLRRDTAAE